ncbi:MAG: hypothetical protein CBC79_01245 [Gammaproteobacteria bacterium TMED119]|nr:MAG: hypothetical protein CBC79_01245 [Gammaproteobacteria bacterium TMED119]
MYILWIPVPEWLSEPESLLSIFSSHLRHLIGMTNTHKLSLAHSSKIFALLQQTPPQRMTEKDSPKAVIVAANLLNNSATRCVFIDMTVPTGATSI